VYSPARLKVMNPCVSITGLISRITPEHDGDVHLTLTQVDPKWLNRVNIGRAAGLVVEIVPDIPIPAPPVGSRVTVVGPWVLDTETGWMEVHPLWGIVPAS